MSPRAKNWLLRIGVAALVLAVSALAVSEFVRYDRMQREVKAARRQQWEQLRRAALAVPERAIR